MRDLTNPFLSAATQVVTRGLTFAAAVDRIEASAELAAMTDEQLLGAVREANEELEASRATAVANPGHHVVTTQLIAAAVNRRLSAISGLRQAAAGADRDALTPRMAGWITELAECELRAAWGLLILPDPPAALQRFLSSRALALALPDDGRLRLPQLVSAVLGIQVCGSLLRDRSVFDMGREGVLAAQQTPGREAEASMLLARSTAWLEDARQIIVERQSRARAESQGRETGGRQDRAPAASASPDADAGATYWLRIGELVQQVTSGALTLDDARRRLLDEIDMATLTAKALYLVSMQHRRLAELDPRAAEAGARLNFAVASQLQGDDRAMTLAYCHAAIGIAAMEGARVRDGGGTSGAWRMDEASFAHAVPELEAAAAYFETRADAHGRVELEKTLQRLLVARRQLLDIDGAVAAGERARQLLEGLLATEGRRPHLVSDVGVTVGNLAEIREQRGDLGGAVAGHYEAFSSFLEAGDVLQAQRALHVIFEISVQLGRFDEAMAAAERIAPLLESGGQLLEAARNDVQLAVMISRVRPRQDRVDIVERAWRIVEAAHRRDPSSVPAGLRLDAAFQAANAYITRISLQRSPDDAATAARRYVTEARAAAADAGTDGARAAALWIAGALAEVTGDLATAEQVGRDAEALAIDPVFKRRLRAIHGAALVKLGRPDDAIAVLGESLAASSDPDLLNLAQERGRLGQAFLMLDRYDEALRAFEAAAEAFEQSREHLHEEGRVETRAIVEDVYQRVILLSAASGQDGARRAWQWLQRARGRALTDALGLAPLPRPEVAPGLTALLDEEGELLRQLHGVRARRASASELSTERLQTDVMERALLARLDELWATLAPSAPEYVELRTGQPPEWEDVTGLLEADLRPQAP